MYKNKTFLGIIPARSGSKGIVDKNIKELNHKPLMAYTIEACVKANIFDQIVVSTDSVKYAKIAEHYGASVPFLRPVELSSDEASTNDVILHVINKMSQLGKTFDYFMLLQPTSPLRNEKHIIESTNIIVETNADSVISICKLDYSSHLDVQISDLGELKVAFSDKKQIRRQDNPQEYRINGAIYLVSTNYFLKCRSFYEGKAFPYFMNSADSIDIDDDFQLKMAELVLLNR